MVHARRKADAQQLRAQAEAGEYIESRWPHAKNEANAAVVLHPLDDFGAHATLLERRGNRKAGNSSSNDEHPQIGSVTHYLLPFLNFSLLFIPLHSITAACGPKIFQSTIFGEMAQTSPSPS